MPYIDRDIIERLIMKSGLYCGTDADKRYSVERIRSLPTADVAEVKWLPVVGYEGLYEVSNFGDVRSTNGSIIHQSLSRKRNTDYKVVWLKKDGIGKNAYVHRLVAEAFIENPNAYPIINHKDEDGTNNRVGNLEWCTNAYNLTYGTAIERGASKKRGVLLGEDHKKKISESMKRYNLTDESTSIPVVCLENGKTYRNARCASEELGVTEGSIKRSCERETVKGRKYTFRFAERKEGGVYEP